MRCVPIWWIGLIALLLLIGAVAFRDEPGASVPLRASSELRILKVSFGTNHVFSLEPFWKRTLRAVMPGELNAKLGAVQQHQSKTRHPALVVWVDECELDGSRIAPRFASPAAVLDGGVLALCDVVETKDRIVRFTFYSYARDKKKVPVQLSYDNKTVSFTIANPRPVTRAKWTASLLPQTNFAGNAQIILGDLRRSGPSREASYVAPIRARAETPVGWMTWRITTFDDLGNWAEHEQRSFTTAPVSVPRLPRTNSVWRLEAEAIEYISAGFVTLPFGTGLTPLDVKPRMRSHGVDWIALFGPGDYELTNGAVAKQNSIATNLGHIHFFESARGTNWSLHFEAQMPAVAWMVTVPKGTAFWSMVRIRERLPGNRGRNFGGRTVMRTMDKPSGTTQIAAISTFNIPPDATNLEVEVVAHFTADSFFIQPP